MDDRASGPLRGRPDPGSPAPRRRMPLRLAIGAAMALAGAIWMLQGLGILTAGGSFMIGDPTWTVIGAVFVVAGAVIAWRGGRRR